MNQPASTEGDLYSLVLYNGRGGVPPPGPAPIPTKPLQEIPRPPTLTTPVDQGFCDPSALLNYPPRPLDVSFNVRNSSNSGEGSTRTGEISLGVLRLADPDDLEDMSARVEATSQEAVRFTELVGRLYDENEGYAPGLSGHEKATTDINVRCSL